jgi:hypothetical protein
MDSVRLTPEVPEMVCAGAPVPITLRLQNTSDKPSDVYLTGRPVAFDIVVAREGGEVVWRRLEGETISMVLQIRQLAPGEVLEFEATWNQRTNRGEPVGPGVYIVHGILPTDEPQPLKTPTVRLRIAPR